MNKRTLLVLPLLAAALGCAHPEVIVRHTPKSGQKYRIAVMPFKDAPGEAGTGAIATETLSTHVLRLRRYDIIEREALEALMKEQKLAYTGAVDQSQAIQIGKLLGADGIVVGSVTEFRRRKGLKPAIVAINARLVSVQSSEVQWTATYRMGGFKPILFLVYWPIALAEAIASPSVEEMVNRTTKRICIALDREMDKTAM